MRVLLVALILPFAFVVGCTPKSEVDKCVEAWEESVRNVPNDTQKRFNYFGKDYTKAEQRVNVRLICMRAAGERQ